MIFSSLQCISHLLGPKFNIHANMCFQMPFLHCIINLSHWSHLFSFIQCAFSNVSSNCLSQRMHSHIGCIYLTFLHCVFANVSSNRLHERMHSHIGCTCLTYLHCVVDLLPSRFSSKPSSSSGLTKSRSKSSQF